MSKQRLPTDIDFLLESVMAETPDKVTFFTDDVAKLNAVGNSSVKLGGLNWKRKDTFAFFIHEEQNVIPYMNARHQDLEAVLAESSRLAFVNPNDFNASYTSYIDGTGNINFSGVGGVAPIGLYGLEDAFGNPGMVVRKYLRSNKDYFKTLNIRGTVPDANGVRARATVPAGRVWTKQQIVSFWNDKDVIMPHMKRLFDFMQSLKVDKYKCAYEFLDTKGFFTYKELFSSSNDRERLSPEEKQKLLQKLHTLSPADKKRAMIKLGMVNVDRDAENARKGFDSPVQAAAAMPALEGTIKLKKLIDGADN